MKLKDFRAMSSSSRQQAQMDAIQSMASMTNTLHGLFGTYELLEFRNLSGQLSRRSIDERPRVGARRKGTRSS